MQPVKGYYNEYEYHNKIEIVMNIVSAGFVNLRRLSREIDFTHTFIISYPREPLEMTLFPLP